MVEKRYKLASRRGRVAVRVGVFPVLKQLLRLLQQGLCHRVSGSVLACINGDADSLLSRIRDIAIRFKQRANVDSLATP